MIITPHAIAATLIAINAERLHVKNFKLYSRKLIFTATCFAAFCSHFFLDFIPHYDYWIYGPKKDETIIKLIFDSVTALAIASFVLKYQFRNLTVFLNKEANSGDLPLTKKEWVNDLPFIGLVLTAMGFSLAPDVLIFISNSTGTLLGYRTFHDFFHSSKATELLWGTLIQVAVSAVMIFFSHKSYKKLCEEKKINFLAESFINGDLISSLKK